MGGYGQDLDCVVVTPAALRRTSATALAMCEMLTSVLVRGLVVNDVGLRGAGDESRPDN
jgi:hypothetical protein